MMQQQSNCDEQNIARATSSKIHATENDGNCFFHAVFGHDNHGVYSTKNAPEMRKEWYNFLKQFKSIKDPNMPSALELELRKVFRVLLNNAQHNADSNSTLTTLIDETKRDIREMENKIDKLINEVTHKVLQNNDFREVIYQVLIKSNPESEDTFLPTSNLNETELKIEIRKNLENCALRYKPMLNNNEFQKKYTTESLINLFLEKEALYNCYLNAILSDNYLVTPEEIPILSTLFEAEVTLYKRLNSRVGKRIFKPNYLLLNENYRRRMKLEKTERVIYCEEFQFSRADEYFGGTQQQLSSQRVETDSHKEAEIRKPDEKTQGVILQEPEDQLSEPQNECYSSGKPKLKDDGIGKPDDKTQGVHLEEPDNKLSEPQNECYPSGKPTSVDNPTQTESDSDASDLESIPTISQFKPHVWRNERSLGNHKVRKCDNLYEGDGRRTLGEDENEYVEGKWERNRLVQLKSCQFFKPDAVNETVYIRSQRSGYLLTSDEEYYVAKVSIDNTKTIDFTKDNVEIKRQLLENVRVVETLKDVLLERGNEACNNLKDFLQDTRDEVGDSLVYKEDLLQIAKSLEKHLKCGSPSAEMLLNLCHNKYISSGLKTVTKKLYDTECVLNKRNNNSVVFNGTRHGNTVTKEMKSTCEEAIKHHRTELVKISTQNYSVRDVLRELPDQHVLFFSNKDIQLFADLDSTIRNQERAVGEILHAGFFKTVCDKLLNEIKATSSSNSLIEIVPLTNPVYFYLFKSFLELVVELADRANTTVKDLVTFDKQAGWSVRESIGCESNCMNYSLEKQCRFIVKLMAHYQPGCWSKKSKFKYDLEETTTGKSNSWVSFFINIPRKLMQRFNNRNDLAENEDTTEERTIWVYVLHVALMSILDYEITQQTLSEETESVFEEFATTLLKGFAQSVAKVKDDRFELFRLSAHNTARFAAQVCSYIFTMPPILEIDQSIFDKQLSSFTNMLHRPDDTTSAEHYTRLVDVYSKYWEDRETIIRKLPEKICCSILKEDMELISMKCLELVDNALSRTVEHQSIINYFRSFNEFLKHLVALKFEWVVNEVNCSADYSDLIANGVVKLINVDNKSYQVTEPEKFINEVKPIPKHYIIEIVKCLLTLTNEFPPKCDWLDDTKLNAESDLLLAVGHSLIHLKNQVEYVDFDEFENDSTQPFVNVTTDISTYEEFKQRLGNIENFFLYRRKLNEIGIDKALELYEQHVGSVEAIKFQSSFNRELLESCYKAYSEKFESYMEEEDTDNIIAEVRGEVIQVKASKIEEWTSDIKQITIPSVLAGLAAVWSKLESKDVSSTGKYLSPHCIQILCILRLLSVDTMDRGVHNHLAQVLTGQGKSVVLGLLSSLIALTGHNVRVVCYSKYLATRDQQQFSGFFRKFGIDEKITYGTFEDMAEEILNPKTDGEKQDLRTLVQKLLRNELRKTGKIKSKVAEGTVLLIDEVDVFFSETFYGNTYNLCFLEKMSVVADLQIEIWHLVSEDFPKESVVKKIKEFIDNKAGEKSEREFSTFLKNNAPFFQRHVKEMIDDAIYVRKASNDDTFFKRYEIINDIINIRDKYGLYSTSTFCRYRNVFSYFRLKKSVYDQKNYNNYGYLNVNCGNISYSKLPMEYPLILGVSGTLTTLNSCEIGAVKSYNINRMSSVPTFFGRHKLEFDQLCDFVIVDSVEQWLDNIFAHLNDQIEKGRAVLVFFQTETEINQFYGKYHGRIDRLNKLTGNEEKQVMDWCINEAGVARSVTLATREMGRGVDFKSNDSSVEEKGGVHVIQTFFSLDVKEEVQIKGRTARKDNKGSYELILCRNHLEGQESAKSYHDLNFTRRTKSEEKSTKDFEGIKASEEKHNKTMEFFKSLSDYTPNKRRLYVSMYPITQ